MQTWSLISGKLLFQKQDVIDLTGFVNFKQEGKETLKRDRALLISEEQVEDARLSDYFQEDQLNGSIKNQKTFIQSKAEKVHHFKYIEIINEEKADLVYEFYLPIFEY
mmetsp:Transcript_33927/g.24975  ORF Transcript_33927/g.24975 Transcript_33927/m.24975 type:complete len:108 (-) Transcript_33927:2694-3017(-)